MIIRIILSFVLLLAVVGVLGGIKASQIVAMIDAEAASTPPPESVTTRKVESGTWTPRLTAIGSLVARRSVVVSPEVSGSVIHLDFESGKLVQKGEVLVRLDTSIERAQLDSAQASARLARLTLDRTESLAAKKIRPQSDLDGAKAELDRAEAAVAQLRAQIAKKTIRAPFSGKLGIREVDLGQIVSPGQALVTLQAVEDLYVDFYLPQQEVVRVREGQGVVVKTDALGSREWTGKIEAIEGAVEVATRNIEVRARIPNADLALWPGMFVEVAIELPETREVLVVPQTAVLYAPYGNTVFVVDDGKVRQVLVEAGEQRGDFVAVRGGLSAGDEVVAAGGFKLRDGMSVVVDNSRGVEASLDPHPEDR